VSITLSDIFYVILTYYFEPVDSSGVGVQAAHTKQGMAGVRKLDIV